MIEIIREETLKEREERRKKERQKEEGKRKETATEEEKVNEELAEEKKDLGIPKNIRQIGESNGKEKIYIEDYVMTHMKQLAAYGDEKPKVLILYGKRQNIEGQPFWFINGAVQAEAIDTFMDQIAFDDNLWAQINETANHFFGGLSIVGWALLKKNGDTYWDEKIVSTHKEFFRANQKIFFEYIISERIENMYLFENGRMDRQSGFYIYYERNEPMQNYMLAYKEMETEQEEEFIGDQATKQFRAIVQEKKERLHRRHTMGLLYGTSAVLVMVIMIIGITMLNNYEKMQSMEKVLYEISGQMDEAQSTEAGTDQNSIDLVAGTEAVTSQDLEQGAVETSAKVLQNDSFPVDNSSIGNETNGDASADMRTAQESTENQQSETSGQAVANENNGANGQAAGNPNDRENGEATANQQENEQGAVNQDSAVNPEAAAGQDSASNPETTVNEDGTGNSASAGEATDSQGGNSAGTENINENAGEGQVLEASGTVPKEYIIQKGDTLAKISRKFYGTESMIRKICELNNIQDMDNIFYGEKILLP